MCYSVKSGSIGIVLGVMVLLTAAGIRPALAQCEEVEKIVAADGDPRAGLGNSVALSGDVMVVGARGGHDSLGSAYVFRFDGNKWTKEARLLASNGEPGDRFGWAVDVLDDRIVASLTRQSRGGGGLVHIFHFEKSEWIETQSIFGPWPSREFGMDVALHGDTLLVATKGGGVYAYRFEGEEFVFQQLINPENAQGTSFGWSVAIDGRTAVIGAIGDNERGEDAGAAYVYRFDGSEWVQEQKLVGSEGEFRGYLGWDVGIDGDTVVLAARGRAYEFYGHAYVFRFDGGKWIEEQRLEVEKANRFGNTVAVWGDNIIVGAADSQGRENKKARWAGSAYIFTFNGSNWINNARLFASDGWSGDRFGQGLFLTADTAYVGAPHENGSGPGAVYTFDLQGCFCTNREKLKKPKCKGKKGRNKLTTKVIRGKAGDLFTIELSSGDNAQGFLNDKGKGKATFSDLPTGPGEATAIWECGIGPRQRRSYECP